MAAQIRAPENPQSSHRKIKGREEPFRRFSMGALRGSSMPRA